MFAKTLIAALVLAGASITFVTSTYAAPTKAPSQFELNWMSRASNPDTNGVGGD